jgi:Helix-turn-helix domain/AraC-like ligand binding domain
VNIFALKKPVYFSSATLIPLQMSCKTLADDDPIAWHAHPHEELCVILEGTPIVGCSAGRTAADAGTLFLFNEAEEHGFWPSGNSPVRFWSLEFQAGTSGKRQFQELFDLPPESRILKLSAFQRQNFCDTCRNLALEDGSPRSLNGVAAAAWLTLQLVNVTRWLAGSSKTDLLDGLQETDPQCFELWQRIHRHVSEPAFCGPMLFGTDPSHDSLRHRFRKLFGTSPQAMLIRLRIDRAKELLRTGMLPMKEIADKLGYSRQHDLTRAFRKYCGMSPTEWKIRSRLSLQK